MLIRFDDIFGQDAAIAEIRRAFASDHLPHGLIFAGPTGVGKATTAGALAALFLCENPPEFTVISGAGAESESVAKSASDAKSLARINACGKCPGCQLMLAGTHPDYHIITKELIRLHDKTGKSKATELSIHVIRNELVELANRKTNLGRGKVFVVEQADLMNTAAQNGLLKTLEEPAGRTLIILLTDRPESLLPTIRSRSRVVSFSALDMELVKEQLIHRGIDRAMAQDASELSDGSLGIAIQWIEDGVIPAARELTVIIEAMLGGATSPGARPAADSASNDLADWLKTSADAYAAKQLERDELASKDVHTRAGLELYLAIAARRLRRRFLETESPDDLERACQAIDAIALAEKYLDVNGNVALVLQQLSMSLQQLATA